jgi:hypothetical protein
MNAPDFEIIFAASRVNGGFYPGDYLTAQHWEWPRDTWLQRRLAKLRESNKGMPEESCKQE